MQNVPLVKQSFSAGVLHPDIHDREETQKGLKKGENILIDGTGAITKRHGTKIIKKFSGPTTRAIPYKYSSNSRFTIAFVGSVLASAEVINDEGRLIKSLTTPYTPTEVEELHTKQIKASTFITHQSHDPKNLRRFYSLQKSENVQIAFLVAQNNAIPPNNPYTSLLINHITDVVNFCEENFITAEFAAVRYGKTGSGYPTTNNGWFIDTDFTDGTTLLSTISAVVGTVTSLEQPTYDSIVRVVNDLSWTTAASYTKNVILQTFTTSSSDTETEGSAIQALNDNFITFHYYNNTTTFIFQPIADATDGDEYFLSSDLTPNILVGFDWKFTVHPMKGGPFLPENLINDIQVTCDCALHVASTSHTRGDLVFSPYTTDTVNISSTRYVQWYSSSYINEGKNSDKYKYHFLLEITTATNHELNTDDTVKISGTTIDGLYHVVERIDATTFTIYDRTNEISSTARAYPDWNEVTFPTSSISSGAAINLNRLWNVYRAKTTTTATPPDAASDSNWERVNLYLGEVTLKSVEPIFTQEQVGGQFRIQRKVTPFIAGSFVATGQKSSPHPAMGSITFTTEAGFWAGVVELRISYDGGQNWEVLGFLSAADGNYNGVIERNIERPDAVVDVYMKEWKTPSGTGTPKECQWKLEFNSIQYSYFEITSFVAKDEVKAKTISPLISPISSPYWSEGKFSGRRGFPRTLTIHEERMTFAGAEENPSDVDFSRINDFEIYMEGIEDTAAFSMSMPTDSNETIQWLESRQQLVAGLDESERSLFWRDSTKGISAQNIQHRLHGRQGCNQVQSITSDRFIYYVHYDGKRLGVISQGEVDLEELIATDASELAYNVTESGIKALALSRHPIPRIYVTLKNGKVAVYTNSHSVKAWSEVDYGGEVQWAFTNIDETEDAVYIINKRGSNYYLEKEVAGTQLDLRQDFTVVGPATGIRIKNGAEEADLTVIWNDLEIPNSDWSLTDNGDGTHDLDLISGYEDGELSIGIKFAYDVDLIDPIQYGGAGINKTPKDLMLILENSGVPQVTVNGNICGIETVDDDATVIGEDIYNNTLINGRALYAVKSDTDDRLEINIYKKDHKPFRLKAIGLKA